MKRNFAYSANFDEKTELLFRQAEYLGQGNNGVVYKSKFKNDEIINTTIVTYDTGAYVIIGTPVIFLTY